MWLLLCHRAKIPDSAHSKHRCFQTHPILRHLPRSSQGNLNPIENGIKKVLHYGTLISFRSPKFPASFNDSFYVADYFFAQHRIKRYSVTALVKQQVSAAYKVFSQASDSFSVFLHFSGKLINECLRASAWLPNNSFSAIDRSKNRTTTSRLEPFLSRTPLC